MFRIVQSEAPNRTNVFQGQRGQQKPDIGDAVRDIMFSEDIPSHDFGLLGLTNVCHSTWEDGISIIGPAILGQEPDESLRSVSACLANPAMATSYSGTHRKRRHSFLNWLAKVEFKVTLRRCN
jgi:hypothetical protein